MRPVTLDAGEIHAPTTPLIGGEEGADRAPRRGKVLGHFMILDCYERAIAIWSKRYAPDHPFVAAALTNLTDVAEIT